MYEYAKIQFIGQGIQKDDKKAFKYFNKTSKNGYQKSHDFLTIFKKMNKIKEFGKKKKKLILPKNKEKNVKLFDQIKIKSNKTDILFYNDALKTTNFYSLLSRFKFISIEILYPSPSFDQIFELVSNVKNNKLNNIVIGLDLQSIPNKAIKVFSDSNISHVNISESITIISDNSFINCNSLKQVKLPFSLTSIENGAFKGCASLEEIIIPNNVTSIKSYAFSECSSLKKIMIPSSVTSIEEHAFSMCSSLNDVSIPSYTTSIKDHTFEKCSSLTQITIPSFVKKVGNHVFSECLSYYFWKRIIYLKE